MSDLRKLPPVWVMGLTNATFGLVGGFAVITLPEMLVAQGVPGGQIAAMVAVVMSPGFWVFLISPMLDVRFSRRSYALFFSGLAALAVGFSVTHRTDVHLLRWVMLAGFAAASLVQGAVGGWMGSLIGKEQDSGLGAWFAVANTGSGGLMALLAGEVIARLPALTAGVLLGGVILLPSLIYLLLPAPGPDRRLASESFGQFFGEVLALVKQREVQIALVLFLLPSASFALTNVLAGIGRDFSATERLVSLLGGVGAAVAGVVGSLLLPPLAKRMALRPLYLAIGVVGGLFTLSLLLMPHTPATFAIAFTGENIFQALAFAAGNAIMFETIGQGNALAATQFTVLTAAVNLPIIYMVFIDGKGYDWRGMAGSFVADAGISIVVCGVLAWGLVWVRRWERRAVDPASLVR